MGRIFKVGCLGIVALVVVIIVVVVAVSLSGGGGSGGGSDSATTKVIYKIGGTAKRADMTFSTTPDGSNISQENGQKLPWTKAFTVKDEFFSVYSLSAQNQGRGTITCSVTVDGKQVAKNTASGQYAIVSCDAS
ncbi:MAG: hypothetical protein ACR2JO_07850 [Mycobacteriales bacterium]